MPRIPIPFIGGAEGPRQSRHEGKRLEPPFYPGREEAASETEPAARPEEAPPPETQEPAAPPPPEEADARERGPEAAAPAPTAEPGELTPVEAASEGAMPPEIEAGSDTAETEDLEVPDWLLGSEEATTEIGESTPAKELDDRGTDSLVRLAEQAEAMLTGSHGDRIRTLIANLSPYTIEIAVPRAFAAGYLAARAEEEG